VPATPRSEPRPLVPSHSGAGDRRQEPAHGRQVARDGGGSFGHRRVEAGGFAQQVVYVWVADVEAAFVQAERLVGTRRMGPERASGRDLVVGYSADPDGNLVGVAGLVRARVAAAADEGAPPRIRRPAIIGSTWALSLTPRGPDLPRLRRS
jgi:hypothetical protein